jgi:CHAT domain-containing protein
MRSRSRDLVEIAGAPIQLAFMYVNAGRHAEALEALENGRARWLRDALARDRAELASIERVDREVAARFRAAITMLREVRDVELKSASRVTRASMPDLTDTADLALQRRANIAYVAYRNAVEEIQQLGDEFADFLAPATVQSLVSAVAPGTPATYVATSSWGTVTITLWHDGHIDAAIDRNLDQSRLSELLTGSRSPRSRIAASYLAAQMGDRRQLARAFALASELVGDGVIASLANTLRRGEATGVVLLPCGGLALLPLHAITYGVESRCLLDDFEVSFAPSIEVLQVLDRHRQVRGIRTSRLVTLTDPTGTLRWAPLEARGVAARFEGAVTEVELGAAPDEVVRLVSGADRVHLACHGRYDSDEFLDSGFVLSGTKTLRLRDLMRSPDPLYGSLVVASACQSAMLSRHPDEGLSLATGFLYGGAKTVIGSLWTVDDLSTALLMTRFYELLDESASYSSPRSALRRAQLWLRDATRAELRERSEALGQSSNPRGNVLDQDRGLSLKAVSTLARRSAVPYRDPYYWAPFVCTGD